MLNYPFLFIYDWKNTFCITYELILAWKNHCRKSRLPGLWSKQINCQKHHVWYVNQNTFAWTVLWFVTDGTWLLSTNQLMSWSKQINRKRDCLSDSNALNCSWMTFRGMLLFISSYGWLVQFPLEFTTNACFRNPKLELHKVQLQSSNIHHYRQRTKSIPNLIINKGDRIYM